MVDDSTGSETRYDIAIIGGGLAGLSLALQLKTTMPGLCLAVIEKGEYPRPEAAFKVGESTVEIGAFYFREILGLKDHLEKEQLIKFGIRFFFPDGANEDITGRVEAGRVNSSAVDSYQLDRGRLENHLKERVLNLGIDLIDKAKVIEIELGKSEELHTLSYLRKQPAEKKVILTRWLVDASGRAGTLKYKLGLAEEVDHEVNSCWFRLAETIKLDNWSERPDWLDRVPSGKRWLSTNHLMGRGYWVWLIPLGSGSISLGIVADNHLHPFSTINRYERALEWLKEHEPQLYRVLIDKDTRLQDFKVLKHFALGCSQVYSTRHWALTGEAGAFLDPFYSVGSDFIAFGNTFITELINRDARKEPIELYVENYNRLYSDIFQALLQNYQRQYPLFGNSRVMLNKLIWDNTLYWGFTAFLFLHKKLQDLTFMGSIQLQIQRLVRLQYRMQKLFRQWDVIDRREYKPAFINYVELPFLKELNRNLNLSLTTPELRTQFIRNTQLLEQLAVTIFNQAASLLPNFPQGAPVNPFAISLEPEAWESEGLFEGPDILIPESALEDQLAAVSERLITRQFIRQ